MHRCLSGFLSLAVLFAASLFADSPQGLLLKDPFDATAVPQRRAMRGDWKFEAGVARCTQDDALYKQFKDHGPILFYDLAYGDATIRFAYRPEKCQTLVFTANGADGHVFRFVTSERGTDLRAFPPGEDAKSISLHRDEAKPLKNGEWVDVVVTLRGPRATVQIGDAKPIEVEHASLARPQVNLSVGFSFGTLSVKDLTVAP
jgi:hypothetical protein